MAEVRERRAALLDWVLSGQGIGRKVELVVVDTATPLSFGTVSTMRVIADSASTRPAVDAVKWMDTVHVVPWVNDAVHEVRRQQVEVQRDEVRIERATSVKGSRWALLKAPEKLTERQRSVRSEVERLGHRLYRAYLLEEHARLLLERPLRALIDATLEHGLSNRRVESMNASILLIQQRAFGFHHPSAFIALAQHRCSPQTCTAPPAAH